MHLSAYRAFAALTLVVAGTFVAAEEKAKPKNTAKAHWKPLFDGKSLAGWKAADYLGSGKVGVKDGTLVMEPGKQMTGLTYRKGDFPKVDYEVTLEGKKLEGDDFFCTTTFPVDRSFCSLVVGGWGGTTVGLSSLNGADASENDTTTTKEFSKGTWYRVRIRVTADKIVAWIDDDKVVDVETKDRKVSTRIECDACKPFGFCTWNTAGAIRDVRVRPLTAVEKKSPEKRPRGDDR